MILATAPDAKSISGLLSGLKRNGNLLVVGVGLEPIEVSMFDLIVPRRSVTGWPNGTAKDSEETMAFSVLGGVKPMIETFGLEQAAEAYQRMMDNDVRFRSVLKIS